MAFKKEKGGFNQSALGEEGGEGKRASKKAATQGGERRDEKGGYSPPFFGGLWRFDRSVVMGGVKKK